MANGKDMPLRTATVSGCSPTHRNDIHYQLCQLLTTLVILFCFSGSAHRQWSQQNSGLHGWRAVYAVDSNKLLFYVLYCFLFLFILYKTPYTHYSLYRIRVSSSLFIIIHVINVIHHFLMACLDHWSGCSSKKSITPNHTNLFLSCGLWLFPVLVLIRIG